MVAITVDDPPATRMGRHDDERDARSVAPHVNRLEEPGVPVAAAFVEGDEDCRLLEQLRPRLYVIDDPIDQGLQNVELRARGMSIVKAVRLDVRDRRLNAAFIGTNLDDRRRSHREPHQASTPHSLRYPMAMATRIRSIA
jgi:hypothetical protein